MEYVEGQEIDWENNQVSTEISHFSKYILINNTKYLDVWKEVIKVPNEEDINKPLDIVLVIDSSGSMSWNDPKDMRKSTAKGFVDELREDDRVSIVDFDSRAYLLSPLTHDKEAAKKAIDRIDSSGGTSLTAGIQMALQQFTTSKLASADYSAYNNMILDFEEPGENGLDIDGNVLENPMIQMRTLSERDSLKYIIMLTDGRGAYNHNLTKTAIDNDVTIYTVGLGDDLDEPLLRKIASETGGRYLYAARAEELVDEFLNLSEDVIDFSRDSDKDGLSDYYEKKLRYSNGLRIDTDPFNPDTDGDGLLDGEEIIISEAKVIIRGREYQRVYAKMKSHPKMKDTDGDGYSDYEEVKALEGFNYVGPTQLEDPNALKWNVCDRDLAMASKIAYAYLPIGKFESLSSWKKAELNEGFEGVAKIEELRGWSVVDTFYKDGGLQMILLKNGESIIVACRGTDMNDGFVEGAKDWYNNATTYALGVSLQTPGAKRYMNNIMKKYKGKKIYVTGHSLGGHIAYNVGAKGISCDIDSIKGVVVFNGLGLTIGVTLVGDLWDEIQLNKKLKVVKNYSVKGDPVSKGFLGLTTFHYGKSITYDKSKKASNEHSMYTFLDILKRYER